MGLEATISAGIATANSLTADLQDTVTHEPWTGNDGFGEPSYGSGVTLNALVEQRQELVRGRDGVQTMSKSKVTIIGPVAATGSPATRQEPIDPRDRFTLPDGSTGPILAVAGLIDPSTSDPYMLEVWIG